MSRTTLAAAAVVAAVAVGGAFFVIQRGLPEIAAPSPTPSTQPSPSLPARRGPKFGARATAPNPPAFPRTAGAWIATGTMGTPRSGHTAVRLLDGRVLVVGGADHDEENDTSAELYDPDSGTWSATGNMAQAPGVASRSRPRCCATARCSWGMAEAQRCTTRKSGPGPSPGRWL